MMNRSLVVAFGLALLGGLSSFVAAQQPVPVDELGRDFQLIGRLHAPLGTLLTVQGVVVEGRFKGYEGGANLRVQCISGSYTQELLQIKLEPSFDYEADDLAKLENGQTYEMTGYETGGYVGIPAAVLQARGPDALAIQTTDHYFSLSFRVTGAKKIEPVSYTPGMFAGGRALLAGTAKTLGGDAAMEGKGWVVVVKRGSAWDKDVEGKSIECEGRYNPDATWKDDPELRQTKFDLVDGTWRLVRLEDQVGKQVSLRGTAWSLNGQWWLEYRGTKLHVDGMAGLPGWTAEMHGCPVIIEGRLERAKLPRIDQISLKVERDLEESFIVRDASWKPLSGLLSPEVPVKDGKR